MIRFKLDKVLDEQNKTMYWLSRKTEIRPNTISKWVNNEQLDDKDKVKAINIEALDRMCSVLNCNVSDLLEHIKDTPKND
ncbi:Cro/Cl family transcriptional regulator [Bacillus glycinifermentans]|uniref:Cro/Cl family transcriptional regulator n=1 Tax=Bacillus glycinifermentans TaxID=1664069 RepID=A0A0J6E2Q5_9BACI|nr:MULTISPECIES: helix-turn-helix transcriptional regulator [Bacillus]ATH91577.1 XRE family transcriptional regulator [Bacillus glycinifermentans]KMM54876.1 Cro/Cl family transcriptional regulator [Bacillus glycinifermentans]KRT93800.1 Cro/Cl family transcriptional regulator [Bacillus glycinifermentans]MDU0072029.1 helix-turn-helix transcriptional regulator [Bacillus sp. IG6]MEC0487373.1 helix-turn-helix transcriptional regulator [Bacillus glycinifermentans]